MMQSKKISRLVKNTLIFVVASCAVGCRESRPISATVSGGSMAPTLPGEHFAIQCEDCGFEFKIDGKAPPRSKLAVCPNCAYAKNSFKGKPLLPAAKGTLQRDAKQFRRWDLVAFRRGNALVNKNSPQRNEPDLLVKRIVGLPGENIKIQDGNIFVNGLLLTKSNQIRKSLRQLCFDSRYQPASPNQPRFAPIGATAWTFGEKLQFQTKSKAFDWLKFQPVKGYRHSGPENFSTAIEDSYSYNQNLARRLNFVGEVEIELDFDCNQSAQWAIRLASLEENYRIEFSNNSVRIETSNQVRRFDIDALSKASKLSADNFDGHLTISIDDTQVASLTTKPGAGGELSIAIGARIGDLSIDRCRIYRDLHYLRANLRQLETIDKCTLKEDEFYVLGDNSPVSIDSRLFGPVSKAQMIGIVEF